MKCKHFITTKISQLEFIPKGVCNIDNSECINPYTECIILQERVNKQLFNYV